MEGFVSEALELLELEKCAEECQNQTLISSQLLENPKVLESKGVCIQKLQVIGQSVGLYGRDVVMFALGHGSMKHPVQLPSSTISTGCIVGVFANCKHIGESLLSGVVIRSSSTEVRVAFDELPSDVDFQSHSGRLQLVKMNNSTTYQRMKRSLQSMKQLKISAERRHFVEVLYGEAGLGAPDTRFQSLLEQLDRTTSSGTESIDTLSGFTFINESLDLSQKKAVLFALGQAEVAIIHGPPGTGKTTTVIEIILQAVSMGVKVLACAPSNIAVDNLVERLARAKVKVVRLGHPARFTDAVQRFSLDALLSRSDSASVLHDVRGDLEKAMSRCGKATQSSDRRKWRSEIKTLRKELKEREEKATSQLLSGAEVVLATTTGAHANGPISFLSDDHFGMIIIDECAQAVEASCWIPLLHASKCVLAGDHRQLPPTIISQEASAKGLSVSLMERLDALYGMSVTKMLTTQYRMNEKIMQWPSEHLYGGSLKAHESVANHLLSDKPGVTGSDVTSIPLLFIDTAGMDISELVVSDEESKGNEGEADLVLHHLKLLLAAGTSPADMAVIAPYNLQVELIRKRLPSLTGDYSTLEVRSVDGFQGREKEAVVISFTRSNKEGQYGFLEEVRRSNVAITRARRHLALIGDSNTLNNEPFLKGMLDHCSEHGEVWSAHQYITASDYQEHHLYQEKPKSVASTVPSKSKQAPQRQSASSGSSMRTAGKDTTVKRPPSKGGHRDEAPSGNILETKDAESFVAEVKEFVKDNEETELSFPSSLTSYQRRIIHEISEQLGLLHTSKGQEPDRHIEVRKRKDHGNYVLKDTQDSKPDSSHARNEARKSSREGGSKLKGIICEQPVQCGLVETRRSEEVEKRDSDSDDECVDDSSGKEEVVEASGLMTKCPICHKLVPKNNMATHTAACSRPKLKPTSHPPPSKMAAKPKKKRASKVESETDPDDLDSLLAEVTQSNSTCGLSGCKKKTNLLGLCCQFCRRRFCMEHGIPEVHGCAEEAKKRARSGKVKPGSSMAQATRRGHLHRKLEKKLDAMSSDRHASAKKNSK